MGIDREVSTFRRKILEYIGREMEVNEWIEKNNIQFQSGEIEEIKHKIDESRNSRDLSSKLLHFLFEDFLRYRARTLTGEEKDNKNNWNFVPTMRGYVPAREELECIYDKELVESKLGPCIDKSKEIRENIYGVLDTFYSSIMMLYQLDLFVVMFSSAFEEEIIEHYPGLVNFVEYIVYGALYSVLEFITRRSKEYADKKNFKEKLDSIVGKEIRGYCLELQSKRNFVFHREADWGKHRQDRVKEWMEEYFRYRYVVSLVIDKIMGECFLVEKIFF